MRSARARLSASECERRGVGGDVQRVDLAEDDVEAADDGWNVGEHVPLRQELERLQEGEARRADLAAVRPIGPVGDEVHGELALRRLDRAIGLAGRHVIALGIELEVVDQRFHGALHLVAGRWRDLAVHHMDRALGQLGQALLDDADALAHLLDPHEVAGIAVAGLADRHVELHAVVDVVGPGPCADPTARRTRAAPGR